MERGFFINGAWHNPVQAERFDLINPATGEKIGSTLLASRDDIDMAVKAAEVAAAGFAAMPAADRAAILTRAADLIIARSDEMARLLTREQGKPVSDNLKEILFGADVLRYYAAEATRVFGTLRPASSPQIRNLVTWHPIGVCAGIVPWNYPIDLYAWKIGPALAAGCPIVVKSPHETPLAIAMMVDCLHEAGTPPGVIADLPGLGPVAGAALAEHPRVRLISATASVPAGQAIMRAAAGNLKRLSLELGGHAPFIVLPGANVAEAAKAAHRRAFSNMGQICITVNRVLVHNSLKVEFAATLAQLAEETVVGNGMDPAIGYGPVQNASVITRTEAHIADAVAKGGRVLAGGKRAIGGDLDRGLYFRPTVIDAPLNSLPMNEESFGPLAAMTGFETMEEMFAIANGLEYGLAAYVYGELEQAWGVAEKLEFGAVGVNVNDTSELQAPFGGWKMSGFGRELGPEGLMTFLEQKHIKLRLRPL
ncbi:aldehyde dehydrogenase [Pseudorhodobacter sp.]|uniref:aldehyde dehydrogenase family protein n=1 Tax=Pseudorhodobacter sp. TaxID=1934400 RepID=UPI0026482DBC|nr:aldehyde dehydrogenase family protein [Pseudorhodobacter sp.]MDN5788060.1 aldehyde dehydrogenase family protein [Pseudorhodobacter sp.]